MKEADVGAAKGSTKDDEKSKVLEENLLKDKEKERYEEKDRDIGNFSSFVCLFPVVDSGLGFREGSGEVSHYTGADRFSWSAATDLVGHGDVCTGPCTQTVETCVCSSALSADG